MVIGRLTVLKFLSACMNRIMSVSRGPFMSVLCSCWICLLGLSCLSVAR